VVSTRRDAGTRPLPQQARQTPSAPYWPAHAIKLTALVDIMKRDGPDHAFDFIVPAGIMPRDSGRAHAIKLIALAAESA
jgi:hypothetical protein